MFGIGWTEILLVGLIALFVLKPKDYPDAMRSLGNFIRKARVMAGDFQQQFNEAMREANLDDVRKTIEEVRDLRGLSPIQHVTEALSKFADETKDIQKSIEAPLTTSTSAPEAVVEAAPAVATPAPAVTEASLPIGTPTSATPFAAPMDLLTQAPPLRALEPVAVRPAPLPEPAAPAA